MEEDAPEDRVLTLLNEALYPGHPLGREVLGTRETVNAMTRDDIATFHERWYRPANLVVSAAGAVDHDEVVTEVGRRLSGRDGGAPPERVPPEKGPVALSVLRRRVEQAHLGVGLRALQRDDEDRFALAVANQVLGGGTASRLFQRVREQLGLAYSVYSYVDAHVDTGALVVYAGTAVERLPLVLAHVLAELRRLADEGVTETELAVAKGYLTGSTVLALEDSAGRMARLGESLMAHDDVPAVEVALDRFATVTADDVARVVDRVVGEDTPTVAVVGPVSRRTVEAML